ncbi:MAG: NAD(P)-dependent alcohol dehydrogenase [Acidobacteriota bacterium]|nr:NAD(P)-dependent alcohol dehydrogenase [Acidobacteriota bacterium]
MRVMEIRDAFGLENLQAADRSDPQPGPGEVQLAMRAASLNYRDLLMVRGHYNPRQPLPLIPCSDGVGEVTAVGEGVSRVAVGDRVATTFSQRWIAGEPTPERLRSTLGGPLDGTLAQSMVLDQEGVVKVPEHLTDEEAATLTCAGLTAWSALFTHGDVQPGDTVLTLGTGGVSIFALQLAKLAGARVIITSSSDEKLERVRQLGADETLNYRQTPEWGKAVRELTDGRGVDLVVEVGGAGTLAESLKAVRFGGRIAMIGVLSGVATELAVTTLLMQQVRIQGILVGHRDGFEAMNRAVAAAEMRPVVDRTFPLAETREALETMGRGEHFGKICLNHFADL